ncbi:thioredoxin family protein [Salmonella enterica subsp. enterica]|nr:thioredoxin family protein [Salmonella enterica subsp. enterica]
MIVERNYLIPDDDAVRIGKMLNNGCRLVVCLCADWCSSCQSWQPNFAQLAQEHPADCFIWLDIDKHPDMVADIDLELLPVLLIQDKKDVFFLGTIRPDISIVRKLLQSNNLKMKVQEPGVRDFLLEDGQVIKED